MHKIGVSLTIILLIVGLWDFKPLFDGEFFQQVVVPVVGIIALCGFMKFALDRA